MILTLQIVLVVTSLIMGLSVLLHKGKGGGLSSLFGGGMQSNLSGSTVVEKNLDRLTIISGAAAPTKQPATPKALHMLRIFVLSS